MASKRATYKTLQLTKESIKTEDMVETVLAEAMVKHFTTTALSNFTAWVVFEKQGDAYVAFLSAEQAETLTSLPTPREKELFLKKLHHPFSLGAGDFRLGQSEATEPTDLSSEENEEFGELSKLIQEPLLSGSFTIDGNEFEFRIIFQAHPLTIDAEKKKAFFTITTGIFLQSAEPLEDPLPPPPWASPANWLMQDSEYFWEFLLKGVRDLYSSKPDDMTEAFITVNAQLKIPVKKSDMGALKNASELSQIFSHGTQIELSQLETHRE